MGRTKDEGRNSKNERLWSLSEGFVSLALSSVPLKAA